jgi:hypothetical protein
MRRSLLPLSLLLLAFTSPNLEAQAKFAIYGSGGAERIGIANNNWQGAGIVGLYLGLANLGPLAFSADARADLSTDAYSGLFGPRLALKLPAFPIKPYAEFLLGFSNYATFNSSSRNATNFAYRGVAGLDTTILPHIDWRVVDFSIGRIPNVRSPNNISLTTGIVVRF